MRRKGYTKEQDIFLIEHYKEYTNKQLAEKLGVTVGSIEAAVRRLGLFKQIHKSWTKKEDEFLKEHYIDMTSEEIGKILGRSINSINARKDNLRLVRNPNWTKEEEAFLIQYYQELKHSEIGKILGKTAGAVTSKCFDMNLYKKEPPWTNEDLEFLDKNYPYMCTKELSEILGRSIISITCIANRRGIKKLPYYCNYHYFDVIDTEEKAYWLGFLMADGWISKKKNDTCKVTGIEIQYGDLEHLQKLNKCLEGNYRITDRWRECNLSNTGRKHHFCCLRIYSSIMHDTLIKHGFTYNKSFDASIPELSRDLQRHFIRGYFDGNGCFALSRNKLGVKFCTASKKLKDDLIKILRNNNINIKDDSSVSKYGTTIYYPEVTSQDERYALLNYMYKDSKIYLDRKYKKYLKALKFKTESHNESLAT